jgi:hypothetical protein
MNALRASLPFGTASCYEISEGAASKINITRDDLSNYPRIGHCPRIGHAPSSLIGRLRSYGYIARSTVRSDSTAGRSDGYARPVRRETGRSLWPTHRRDPQSTIPVLVIAHPRIGHCPRGCITVGVQLQSITMVTCPRCAKGAIQIVHMLELGPDGSSDEFTFKTFNCSRCPLVGVGYYEESRRGSSERWHHRGYETLRVDFNRVNRDLESCPDRSNARCPCAVHQRYGVLRDGSHAAMGLVTIIGDLVIHLG